MKMQKTEPCKGHAAFRCAGKFLCSNESFLPQDQLPQFLPRIEWPADPDRGKENRKGIPTTVDWSHGPSNVKQRGALYAGYPQLKPMPPWVDNRYDGTIWHDHLTHVHSLHTGLCKEFHQVSPEQMSAMLRILSYGMSKTTAIMPPWQVFGSLGNIGGADLARQMMVPGIGGMRAANIDHPDVTPQEHQQRIAGRRWIIIPILHGGKQWTISTFDRRNSQLYLVDSGEDTAARKDRLSMNLKLWYVWWNWMGFPHHFEHYIPPVTMQSSSPDSGLICMAWVLQNFRNCVEDGTITNAAAWPRWDLVMCDKVRGERLLKPRLHLHDWVHDGCPTFVHAIRSAHNIMRSILSNELGLSNDPVFNRRCPHSPDPRSSSELVKDALKTYRVSKKADSGLLYPEKEFWTNKGGPQYAIPDGDHVQFVRPRFARVSEQAVLSKVPVRTDPEGLSYPPPRHDLNWPPCPYYTDDHTLADSIADLTIAIKSPGTGSLADESDLSRLSDYTSDEDSSEDKPTCACLLE